MKRRDKSKPSSKADIAARMWQRLMEAVRLPALWGDVVKEVELIAKSIMAHRSPCDIRWHVGLLLSETIRNKRKCLWMSWAVFWKDCGVKHLWQVDRALVWALINFWLAQGSGRGYGRAVKAGAVMNNLVFLRTLLAFFHRKREMVDKIVPTNREVLRYMRLPKRKFFDGRNKSLEGNGVRFRDIFTAALKLDPTIAVLFLISWRFGFRLEEGYKWDPHKDFEDGPIWGTVWVRRGAKNGRKRKFTIMLAPIDRSAVQLAKRYVKKFATSDTRALIANEKSEKCFRNRIYRTTRKIGLTRKGLGITPHGLRHSFAQRHLYQDIVDICGSDAPPVRVMRKRINEIRRRGSRRLGHDRSEILVVYGGSMKKPFWKQQVEHATL